MPEINPSPHAAPNSAFAPRWAVAVLFAITGLIYLWICTDRSWNLYAKQDFGDIYDHLAISMIHGRLDLPPEVIGGEAFIVDGKYYGYWAPFPAMLRLPLALSGSTFWIGHTSRLLCWLSAMMSAFAAWRLLVELQKLLRWPGRGGFFPLLYLAAIALGSHLPYLLAGTSVYHEAVLWGSATAMLAVWWGVGFLNHGKFSWLLGAVGCAGASALTRATTGYGALVGTSALVMFYLWSNWRRGSNSATERWREISLVALTGVLLVLPFYYNYVRFGSFVHLPYDQHPNVAPWRLEITRHGNFQPVNLLPNTRSYFDPGHFDVRPGFPYFHLSAYQPQPGSRIEHAEAYAGIPAFMTGLCFLALWGIFGLAREGRLALVATGGGATLLALLAFTAVAHRYEHDLFPLMVLMSGSGLLWLDQRKASFLRVVKGLLVLLLLLGIWQSLSFAYFELEWARAWTAQKS